MKPEGEAVPLEYVISKEVSYISARRLAIAEAIAREKVAAKSRKSSESKLVDGDSSSTSTLSYNSSTDSWNSTNSSSISITNTPEATPFDLGTVGLALSGGGIRSASFNLGVLQALAQQKLISNIDYLSTVSGGGYIGSWLSAWIRRDGSSLNVEKLIVPEREVNATAERLVVDVAFSEDKVFNAEAEPIRHLRENTNFLAPRPGMLSTDSWTLLAIYLRNMLLNACVVVPTLVAMQLAAMLLMKLYSDSNGFKEAGGQVISPYTSSLFFGLGLVLLFGILYIMWRALSETRVEAPGATIEYGTLGPNREYLTRSFTTPIALLVAACFCFAVYVNCNQMMVRNGLVNVFNAIRIPIAPIEVVESTDQLAVEVEREIILRFPQAFEWTYVLLLAGLTGLLHTLPNIRSYVNLFSIRTSISNRVAAIQWIFSGFFAGFVLVLLSLASFHAIHGAWTEQIDPDIKSGVRLTMIVPLLLWSYFIAESVQIGILGRLEIAEVREKWSYLHSYSFIAAMAWLAVFSHACVIPSVISYLIGTHWHQLIAPSSIWAALSGTSLWLAHSEISGSKKIPLVDIAIKIGPPIVLSGALLCIALCTRAFVSNDFAPWQLLLLAVAALLFGFIASTVVDVNVFSLQELYQNRLVRAFLGASRIKSNQKGAPFRSSGVIRSPDPITHIDSGDDMRIGNLSFDMDPRIPWRPHTGQPLQLVNTAINLQGENELERQERQAESFTLSPLYCGCPRTGYSLTKDGYANGLSLGAAFAISGAAVSPNMGYYSSPAVTALLTFFNLRLGAWMPNPAGKSPDKSGPMLGWVQLLSEMVGWTTSKSDFVYLSDGGHFDNLGVYELLRRRCRYIISCDGGADPTGSCHELAMIVRKAFIDFGIQIEIDLSRIATNPETGLVKSRVVVGKVLYPPRHSMECEQIGYLIYVKSSMDGSEPSDIQSYRQRNPQFPHQSTIDQFFSESQFESYRHLGHHIADRFFSRDQSEFVSGHPMKRPEYPRKPLDVQRFFEYIMAIESMSMDKAWDKLELRFNQEHGKLETELRVNPLLSKLLIEINSLTTLLDLRERQQFDSKLRKKSAELEPESLEFWAAYRKDRNDDERRAEMGWAVQAIRTLDDVMRSLKMDTYHSSLSRGWMRIARRWMLTSSFDKVWESVHCDYSCKLGEFVKSLKSDKAWTPRKES